MNREKFEKLVMEALKRLPKFFKDKLKNVDVVIEEESVDCTGVSLPGAEKRLILGLYQGVPLPKRHHHYGMVMPDKISIFKKNIEKVCKTDKEVIRLVAHTVQHELAHHFGISDKRLRDLGVY
ncbi:MAG: metallopeptidase family protein [Candidatus Omnitrophica bacterium]|nr:metallopeptidase family protein [Candidatus Omnitrophota bacterium]